MAIARHNHEKHHEGRKIMTPVEAIRVSAETIMAPMVGRLKEDWTS